MVTLEEGCKKPLIEVLDQWLWLVKANEIELAPEQRALSYFYFRESRDGQVEQNVRQKYLNFTFAARVFIFPGLLLLTLLILFIGGQDNISSSVYS